MLMDYSEGVGESSTPPRSNAVELAINVYERLMESGSDEVQRIPNLLDLLDAHFTRLPSSYGLDVNLDRPEDVLLHHMLLEQAEIPSNRPVFYIRFLERLYTKSDGNEDLPLTSVNSELRLSHKQQKVVGPSSKRTRDGAAEFEPSCSKLEELNLDVLKNTKDMAQRTSNELPKWRVQEATSVLTHEVIFSTVDKPKLLSQLSALLSDIGLNIREAHVFSTIDGYSLDVFVVDGWHEEDTDCLIEAMKNAIANSEHDRSSHSHSAIERALTPTCFDWEVDIRLLKRGENIGSGSGGDVYRGTYMGQDVAIKELNPGHINAASMSEFIQEVKILREVQHKNVVHFFGACTKSPFMCIVTEYMSGGSLYDYLHNKHITLKLSELLKFASDICKGMEYLHMKNIIHRDLKTVNLLLNSKNVVKVSDFGVARFQSRGGVMTAETGTYRWMAPEVMNHLPYDHRADVFSFAVVLWELVTAKVPYSTMTPLQAAMGVRQGLRPKIPESTHPKLAELIQRCWSTDPTKRPAFSDIALELECLLQEVEVSEGESGSR